MPPSHSAKGSELGFESAISDVIDDLLESAERVAFLAKKYGIPEGIVSKAVDIHRKYAEWICRMIKDGNVILPEDEGKLREVFSEYDRLKNTQVFPPDLKDINVFDSFGDLYRTVRAYSGEKSNREKVRVKSKEGQQVILDQPPYQVVKITTPEAAADLCRNTGWCVKDPKFSKRYLSHGDLYLIFKNGERYALYHPQTHQLKDPNDNPLRFEQGQELLPLFLQLRGMGVPLVTDFRKDTRVLIHPELGKTDPRWAYQYAVEVVGGRWPEGEKAIAKDSATAIEYVRNVAKERVPEMEPIILTNPGLAYIYARDVIKGPWPEAEKVISKDPTYTTFYVRNILKSRWLDGEDVAKERIPEMESIILTNPGSAYTYARDVIKGPWPEAEEVISKDPTYTAFYARNILKRRWPEGEKAILQSRNGHAITLYAADVIGGRWPEGEKVLFDILRDPDLVDSSAVNYAARVIGGRWPEAEPLIMRSGISVAFDYSTKVIGGRWPEYEEYLDSKGPDSYHTLSTYRELIQRHTYSS